MMQVPREAHFFNLGIDAQTHLIFSVGAGQGRTLSQDAEYLLEKLASLSFQEFCEVLHEGWLSSVGLELLSCSLTSVREQ